MRSTTSARVQPPASLRRALAHACLCAPLARTLPSTQEPLPEPLHPGNHHRRSSTCLLLRQFDGVVVQQCGFQWRNERPDAKLANEKWGGLRSSPVLGRCCSLTPRRRCRCVHMRTARHDMACLCMLLPLPLLPRPVVLRRRRGRSCCCCCGGGGALQFRSGLRDRTQPLPTTLCAQGELRGDTNEVVLSFLKSYAHMGRARVECVEGCRWEPVWRDGGREALRVLVVERGRAGESLHCAACPLPRIPTPSATPHVRSCNATTFDGYWERDASLTELHRFRVGGWVGGRAGGWADGTSSPDGGHKVSTCHPAFPLTHTVTCTPAAVGSQATPHERCRVNVSVLGGSNSPDGGHKVKLSGVMVAEGPAFYAYGRCGSLFYFTGSRVCNPCTLGRK